MTKFLEFTKIQHPTQRYEWINPIRLFLHFPSQFFFCLNLYWSIDMNTIDVAHGSLYEVDHFVSMSILFWLISYDSKGMTTSSFTARKQNLSSKRWRNKANKKSLLAHIRQSLRCIFVYRNEIKKNLRIFVCSNFVL